MFFRCEIFDEKGKIIELRHVELSVGSVEQALRSAIVNKLKNSAKDRGFGFRVKREDN